jgi:hypothetical protein
MSHLRPVLELLLKSTTLVHAIRFGGVPPPPARAATVFAGTDFAFAQNASCAGPSQCGHFT